MDVILHLGAHRTGTASFQDYMRRYMVSLEAQGVGFWGPRRSTGGLHDAVHSCDLWRRNRAFALVQSRLEQARARGVKHLVVSDAQIIGGFAENLREARLYHDAGDRVARFSAAFGGRIASVLLSPRSLDHYWSSALASAVFSGHPIPARDKLHQIGTAHRGWREIITDIAAALPDTEIRVLPFETYAGRPDAFLSAGLGQHMPFDRARVWLNRGPTLPDLRRALADKHGPAASLPFGMGRWNPFTTEEYAALRELYADDMMWLTAGADGLALLTEDRRKDRAGPTPPLATEIKGRSDEHKERQLARPG